LASAVQRLPWNDRWSILEGLLSHVEDIADNNLPRMYWFGLEPLVPLYPERALALAVAGSVPALQEFVARRLVSGDTPVPIKRTTSRRQQSKWQWTVQKVAPGFQVRNVGEGGVVHHEVFRNTTAVQTHPLDPQTPSSFYRELKIPADKKTELALRVSHHPHGDWQLRVVASGEVLVDQIVGSQSVAADEWLDVTVNLTEFAGRTIRLSIENRPNNWRNEWAYWNRISIQSE